MGPGGLTLDAYKGRSFHVKRKEEVRLHETPRTPSSEHGGPKKQDKLRNQALKWLTYTENERERVRILNLRRQDLEENA